MDRFEDYRDRVESLSQLLRQHQCCADGAGTVGWCVDSGRCGCSCGLLLEDTMNAHSLYTKSANRKRLSAQGARKIIASIG